MAHNAAQSRSPDISVEELRDRVTYSLLLPAVRLSRTFDLPLKKVGNWLQMAYFHELKARGLKLHEAAALLGVSARKVAMLSKRLKENFLQPDREAGLPRRLEFMLWAEPLSRARIRQTQPDEEPKEIDQALNQLLAEGRVVRHQDGRRVTYGVAGSEARLVASNWQARIDALDNLLGNVCNAIYGRFFCDEPKAFARTVKFRVREQDVAKLHELYRDVIWERLKQFEEAAESDPDAVKLDFSVCWAPYEYLD